MTQRRSTAPPLGPRMWHLKRTSISRKRAATKINQKAPDRSRCATSLVLPHSDKGKTIIQPAEHPVDLEAGDLSVAQRLTDQPCNKPRVVWLCLHASNGRRGRSAGVSGCPVRKTGISMRLRHKDAKAHTSCKSLSEGLNQPSPINFSPPAIPRQKPHHGSSDLPGTEELSWSAWVRRATYLRGHDPYHRTTPACRTACPEHSQEPLLGHGS